MPEAWPWFDSKTRLRLRDSTQQLDLDNEEEWEENWEEYEAEMIEMEMIEMVEI